MRILRGRSDEEWDRIARITRLATYNAEVGRGLVHTDEWRAFMKEEQDWWNSEGSNLGS